MSLRRNTLLSLVANSYKWLPYSYEYLFHNLIPEKIATFNKWNEEVEVGGFNTSTSTFITGGSGYLISTSYSRCLPNKMYHIEAPYNINSYGLFVVFYDQNYTLIERSGYYANITSPSHACYFKVAIPTQYYGSTTYNHDICINESNANLNGTYMPYKPRNVKDKSKVVKIEGNSEVVNQLIEIPATDISISNFYGVDFTDNRNGTYLVNGTATGSNSYFTYARKDLKANHKYLLFGCPAGGSSSTYMMCFNTSLGANVSFDYGNGVIYTPTADDQFAMNIRVVQNGSVSNKLFTPQLIDLTQQYPFDTPTTLTDTRVQNIIRKGYIPYNTGEIKDTDMGGNVSRSFNIWNEEWLNGYWNQANGNFVSNSDYVCSKDPIRVLPNTEYYFLFNKSFSSRYANILFYKDTEYIGKTVVDYDHYWKFTTPSNCNVIKFYCNDTYGSVYTNDICINRSSSLNGTYKPFDDFVDLAHFNPIDINGIHDEFKALDNGNLFRKKTLRVDLATLSWTKVDIGTNVWWSTTISGMKYVSSNTEVGNAISNNYTIRKAQGFSTSVAGEMAIDTSDIKINTGSSTTQPSGTLDYELATYQTTNMPLRHLGMVKLKDLTWEKLGTSPNFRFQASVSGFKKTSATTDIPHVYCSQYTNVAQSNWYSYDKVIFAMTNETNIDIKDTQYNDYTADQFKNHFTDDDYLYFETADITDETDILTYTGTLPFAYQGSGFGTSHDTMEITDTEVVFTRNNWWVDFSKGSWGEITSANGNFWSAIFTQPAGKENGYELNTKGYSLGNPFAVSTDKIVLIYKDGNSNNLRVILRDNSITQASDITGIAKYEMLTPQITRIPKNKINRVDLGSLNWEYVSDVAIFRVSITDMKTGSPNVSANIYCHKYKTIQNSYASGLSGQNGCCNVGIANTMFQVCDTAYTNATDFKNAVKGQYLYYETTNESTLPDTFSIQACGEVSSYAFEWVENQQVSLTSTSSNVKNVDVVSNGEYLTFNGTPNDTGGRLNFTSFFNTIGFVNNHKYLVFFNKDLSTIDLSFFIQKSDNTIKASFSSQAYLYSCDETFSNAKLGFNFNSTSQAYNYEKIVINIVDLNVAFPSGDIPTSTSDSRIQTIIEKGYIPTNTSGTLVFEETEVLPNEVFKDRCK